jgi:hypothetical protein
MSVDSYRFRTDCHGGGYATTQTTLRQGKFADQVQGRIPI